jgi:hypothetical protein
MYLNRGEPSRQLRIKENWGGNVGRYRKTKPPGTCDHHEDKGVHEFSIRVNQRAPESLLHV